MKTTETHGPPTSKHHFNQKSFILEIQKAKYLWDTKNVKYKEQIQADLAWERIANQFKIPKVDAMRRWTVMRAKYRQEKQNPSKSVWPLFSSMTFLDYVTEKQSVDKSLNHKDNQKRSSGGGGGGGDSSSSSSTTQHKSSSSGGTNVHHRRSSGSSKDKPYSRHNKYGNSTASSSSKDNKLTGQNDSTSASVAQSGDDIPKSNKAIINDVKIKTEPIDEYDNIKNDNDESNNCSNNHNTELLVENFPGDDDNEFIEVQIIDGDDEISMSENGLFMGLSENIAQQINNSNNHKQNENDIVQQGGYESKCRAFGKYIGEELCSMKDEGGNAIIMQIIHLILQAKNK